MSDLPERTIEKAWAKLNLSLDVGKKRDDGYHDMIMVMQTVSLCDDIELLPVESSSIRAFSNLPYIPGDERNLAVKAARLYLEAAGASGQGLRINIRKNIPVGAGMAGGSSDAAAVLRGLNRMYGNPLSTEALLRLSESIGSDVAFCLVGGTVLATGRGEVLESLRDIPDCHFVICKPEFAISTPELFRKLDAVKLRRHPDTAGILSAIEAAQLGDICRRMYNVFEDVDDRRMASVRKIKSRLIGCNAIGSVMTGTGSAVFGIFETREQAESAYAELKKEVRFVCCAEPVGRLL